MMTEEDKLNKDNAWSKQLKEFLLGGNLPKGRPAIRSKNSRVRAKTMHKSEKQQAALRR